MSRGLTVTASGVGVSGALTFTHVYMGAGFFGPPRLASSGSYHYVLLWASLHAWGWALLIGAAATMLAPHLNRHGSAVMHVIAAVPLLALSAAFLCAQFAGLSQGWGGAGLLMFPVAAHVLLVIARYSRESGCA